MDIKVIGETRDLLIPCTTLGTTLEDNATELHFIISEKLNELKEKNLIIVNSAGSFKLPLDSNNSVMLDSIVTYDEVAAIQLVLSDSVKKMWRSKSYEITLYSSIDSSGRNPISDSVKEAQEEYRQQLAQAVSTFYGEDYSEYEWNDLVFSVASAVALNAEPVTVKSKWGKQKILPPEGKNSFSEVNVEPLQQRHETFTYNGTWAVSDDPETDGYWTSVTVDVPIKQPHLTDITVSPDIITRTYDKLATEEPSFEPFDGINRVTVKAVDSSIDSDIVPENIREGKTILGVTGNIVPLEGELADKVSNYNALTNAFSQCTTLPSILLDTFNLETDEETAEKKYIRLPYLNTKNMFFNIWSPAHSTLKISNSIVECGFDVSACKAISTTQNSLFVGAKNLKKTKLTGIRSLDRMWYMFFNAASLVEIELGDNGTAPEALDSLYWQAAFSKCTSLQAITGDPLDMSRGDYYSDANDKGGTQTFYNCSSLRYVRFKVGTICHNLNLSYCPLITKGEYGSTEDNAGTIISILNGIRDYVDSETTPSFKVIFSNSIKSYFSKWKVLYNNETKLWEYSEDLGATTLESAFSGTKDSAVSIPNGKGVELAWVT